MENIVKKLIKYLVLHSFIFKLDITLQGLVLSRIGVSKMVLLTTIVVIELNGRF